MTQDSGALAGSLGMLVAPPGLEAPDPLSDAVSAGALQGLWWPDHWMGWGPRTIWSDLGRSPKHGRRLISMPIRSWRWSISVSGPVLRSLGTAVTDVVRRHPVGLMQSVESVLRTLPATTVVLGLGVGEGENLNPYGLARATVGKAAETLDVLRAIRAEGEVTYEGRWWNLDRAPAPAPHARARLRLWLAAQGPRMRRLAAEAAEGWIPVGLSPEVMHKLGREMRPSNGSAWETAVCIPAAVLDDDLLERDVISSAALRWLALFWDPAAFRHAGVMHPLGASADAMANFIPGHLGPGEARDLLEATPPAVVRQVVRCGTREQIAALLRRYDAAGVNHVVVWEVSHLVEPERRARSIELMCDAWSIANERSTV